MTLSKRSIYIISVVILTIALDQISKFWVRINVAAGSQSEIIGQFFTLHNVENEGAFLGMGSELNETLRVILLLILPIVVLGFVLRYIFKDKTLDNWSIFAFSSIIGGGLGNVYDRIIYGSVTDFWHIDLGGPLRTGIFNMADLSVTTGMIILVFVSFKKKKKVAK
ncbi:lipoprotein signal peptidase [Pseudalgibacter alginicilyticus]|uniref:Lipoprotein signal peptidase n=1 Tax=Pseudalgibacter alginicilyticus TaxID=1736674 RepID=A0A0P0CQY0_9FLAO|nr:signal peptidase II [Pseudalgibacter alginicilyticus]ALJ05232.1 lipoprotein signal peptidase [Pseudalgibacter alginicilyticus]